MSRKRCQTFFGRPGNDWRCSVDAARPQDPPEELGVAGEAAVQEDGAWADIASGELDVNHASRMWYAEIAPGAP